MFRGIDEFWGVIAPEVEFELFGEKYLLPIASSFDFSSIDWIILLEWQGCVLLKVRTFGKEKGRQIQV